MLPQNRDGEFRFGVSTFPSLYADALYTLDAELDRIFEVAGWDEIVPPPDGNGAETRLRALTIGKSVVFDGYDSPSAARLAFSSSPSLARLVLLDGLEQQFHRGTPLFGLPS